MSVCMVVGLYCSLTCPNDVLYKDPQSLCLSVCLSVWWWAPTAAQHVLMMCYIQTHRVYVCLYGGGGPLLQPNMS